MGTSTLVPVEAYLHTVYRPDRDYIEGEVMERNMGEVPHSRLQVFLVKLFARKESEWNIEVLTEARLQVSQTRFRVPDLTVARSGSVKTSVLYDPPLLCIEIFSSDDRMIRMRERVVDYMAMGVPAVWAIDPWRRVAYFGNTAGELLQEDEALTVPGTLVRVSVAEFFGELDRLEQQAGSSQRT